MFKKHAVIISGLAASGKTTLGKLFESLGYLLIDDPLEHDFDDQTLSTYTKIVITSPFLTISEHRMRLKDQLLKNNFQVTSFVLDADEKECSNRARKMGKKVDGLNRYLLKKSKN